MATAALVVREAIATMDPEKTHSRRRDWAMPWH